MILGIEKEISVFLQAMLAGNLLYLVYCAICIFRRIIRHNLFFVSLEDFFYWIGTGVYLFLEIYHTSNGSIRWYFAFGVAIGGLLSHYIIRKIIKKYVDKTKKTE